MNIGMLWFDNNKIETINTKIEHAAQYYQKKYGIVPTLCYIHPSMMPSIPKEKSNGNGAQPDENKEEKSFFAGSLEVRSNHSVLPNHYWIGVNGNS